MGNNYGILNGVVSKVNVRGNTYVGGIVGTNNDGTVSNSISYGTVRGYDCVGGIAGADSDMSSFTKYSFEGTVSSQTSNFDNFIPCAI